MKRFWSLWESLTRTPHFPCAGETLPKAGRRSQMAERAALNGWEQIRVWGLRFGNAGLGLRVLGLRL